MLYSPYDDGYQQRLAKYENGVWQDITDANFLNAEKITFAMGPDNLPYVVYRTGNQLTVTKYRSGSCETVGDTGFAEVSNGSDKVLGIVFDSYGTIYVAYQDRASDNKVTVIKYQMGWTILGNAGFSLGQADSIGIAVELDDNIYAYYLDETNAPPE